ncbi:MAG: hypothetical protein AB7S41_08795 [Parvibaculaceae bacterium]
MGTSAIPARADLGNDVPGILRCLPRMGKVMLTTRLNGATHERIGPVAEVFLKDGIVACRGAMHDSRIDPAAIASVIVDRTGRMRDTVLPRLDFRDAEAQVVFSIVGMEGPEAFDTGLAAIGVGTPLPEEEKPEREPATLGENDPGALPFEAAARAAEAIRIEIDRPGLHQAWSGKVEAVKPGMGFINVMQPDFHLHLRGGAVASWKKEVAGDRTVLRAIGPNGMPIGLSVHGLASIFSGL